MKKELVIGLLEESKPAIILDLRNGQGSFNYNHNIKEVLVIKHEDGSIEVTDDPKVASGKMFQYDCVRVEYPRTADNIFGTLLTAKYPSDTENKMVNEYQSAMLKLLPASAKQSYEAFLKDRLAIRQMVDEDCAKLNIPTDL